MSVESPFPSSSQAKPEASQADLTHDSAQPDQSKPERKPQIRLSNLLVALAAVLLSVTLFWGVRSQTQVPSLKVLAEEAVPLELALANPQPTLMEFYADWCVSCQTMAPMMADLEQTYHDRLNFVMLNVDNDKWLPELLRYRVDGIPHFVFLDPENQPIGETIGEQPRSVMAANLDALLAGDSLPYVRSTGRTSAVNTFFVPDRRSVIDPRSHSSQAKLD